jgi:N-acetylglutamate synthase-like GNAT family acetyltransferase
MGFHNIIADPPTIGHNAAFMSQPSGRAPVFSEKGFYLQEFRGRTLAFCAPPPTLTKPAPLLDVLEELRRNDTGVLVMAQVPRDLATLGVERVIPQTEAGLEGEVWRELREFGAAGLLPAQGRPFAAACRELAVRLGIWKLVWLDPDGGLAGSDGRRDSFVDLAELRRLAADPAHPRAALLREIQALLEAGIAAVNVCATEGVADELFTYAGSGTLFTRKRYLEVRRLGIDDYDAAADLIARGVEEGYLAPRPASEVDRVLASGFGAFVEGRHLAGIGALLVYPEAGAGEIASIYTLTRYIGEGVGGHLIAHALDQAEELGLRSVFACTTQERVAAFFERHGFAPARSEDLPPSRWEGYDGERRARLRCFQLALGPR